MSEQSSIVNEVRQRRMEISAAFDHDLRKYAEHLMQLQNQAEYRGRLVRLASIHGGSGARVQDKGG